MKVVKTAVQVIGIIATVASFIPGPHQPIAAIVAKVAAVVSAGLAIATRPPRPTAKGSPTNYLLDPSIGIPYMMGRTQHAGVCAKRETWGSENKNQAFLTVYSLGPINAFEQFTADQEPISFKPDGDPEAGNAIGQLKDFLFLNTQVGECPSPPFMVRGTVGQTNVPGWDAVTGKLSGLAASWLWMRWDKKQRYFTGGPPVPGMVLEGVLVYDPRLDSTFPGGVGPCRALDESTYVYSETPHLHALTYALGRYQNGKRRFGIGMPAESIDIEYFANAANIDEANGWKVGGLIWSTDNKWNALKQIMQAGGGQPITLGGRLSGMQRAPRVSTHTITSEDLCGKASKVATQTQRERINGVIPRFRSEEHGWEYIPATAVRSATLVAFDGGERTKEIQFDLVQDKDQATQLAGYEIMDAREVGPIDLTLKLRWYGLRPGDCVTLNIPELDLVSQKVVVISRSIDVESGAVSMQFRTEDDAKHTFALGLTGGVPPVQDPWQPPVSDANPPVVPTTWVLAAEMGTGPAGGTQFPVLRFTGTTTNTVATQIEFSYRLVGAADWTVSAMLDGAITTHAISGLTAPANYEGRVIEYVNGIPSPPQLLGPVSLLAPEIVYDDVDGGPDPDATVGDNVFENPRLKTNSSGWNLV